MLAVRQYIPGMETLFLNPVPDDKGGWVFRMMMNGKVVKEIHSLTHEENVTVRGEYINSFWGNKLN